jgi:serine O-acetyltransferase
MSLTFNPIDRAPEGTYACVGGINHVDGKNLPSKHVIADITIDLLRLLSPGFFDEAPIHSSEIEAVTRRLLDSVPRRLENEARKSLEYAPPVGIADGDLSEIVHLYPQVPEQPAASPGTAPDRHGGGL